MTLKISHPLALLCTLTINHTLKVYLSLFLLHTHTLSKKTWWLTPPPICTLCWTGAGCFFFLMFNGSRTYIDFKHLTSTQNITPIHIGWENSNRIMYVGESLCCPIHQHSTNSWRTAWLCINIFSNPSSDFWDQHHWCHTSFVVR